MRTKVSRRARRSARSAPGEPSSPVGIRELKNRLSEFLRLVKHGRQLVVTERGRAVALISPPPVSGVAADLEALVRQGLLRWAGGKPRGSARPARLTKGPPISQTVIEGRR